MSKCIARVKRLWYKTLWCIARIKRVIRKTFTCIVRDKIVKSIEVHVVGKESQV